MAYYLVEPCDVRLAIGVLASTVANIGNQQMAIAMKQEWKREMAAKPSDFMAGLRLKRNRKPQPFNALKGFMHNVRD